MVQGPTGTQGVPGPKGSMGSTRATGVTGPKGTKEEQGTRGFQGAQYMVSHTQDVITVNHGGTDDVETTESASRCTFGCYL